MGFEFQEFQGRLTYVGPELKMTSPNRQHKVSAELPELSCQGAGVTWLVALTSYLEMTP